MYIFAAIVCVALTVSSPVEVEKCVCCSTSRNLYATELT
jgi:hypothetical protein